ncbi:MAG: hypothetical protein H6729_16695 [Deltaproteobacteria bacterium]|nr:hypothetical protein [Deltaproteobacteria bacterium]
MRTCRSAWRSAGRAARCGQRSTCFETPLRALSRLLPLSPLLLGSMLGCAIGDGDPWAAVRLSASAEFSPPPARTSAEGRLLTSGDFALEVDRLEIAFAAVTVELEQGTESTTAFDPANPPDGYTLCHNGHCHSESGALVSYEDIAAELGASSATGQSILTAPLAPDGVSLTPGAAPISLELMECADVGCTVDRGRLVRLGLEVASVSVVGRAYDLRVPARLPIDGLPFAGEWSGGTGLVLLHALDLPVDSQHRPDIRLRARFGFPAEFFDGVDFSDASVLTDGNTAIDLSRSSLVTQKVEGNLTSKRTLEVTVDRL